MAIRIEVVGGGWTVTDEATGRMGVAVTKAQVAQRVRELLEATPADAPDVDEAGNG